MLDLKTALHNCLKNRELFLYLINDYAVEGFLFWDKEHNESVLLDAKLSSEFGFNKSVILLTKELSDFYAHFVNLIMENVEAEYYKDISEPTIKEIDLDGYLQNTEIKFSHHIETTTKQEYFLVAIYSTDYFYKGKRLAKYSNTFDIATWQLNVLSRELIINDKWANILGYELEELKPVSFQTFVDLAHPDDVQSTIDKIDQYVKGEIDQYSNEIRMRHKNGYWRWVLGKGKVVSRNEAGEVEWMMGLNYDITDKKIQEEEADTLSLVPLHSFNSIVITDSEGKITFVNKSFEKLTGYKADEVIAKKPGSFLQGPNTDPNDILSFSNNIRSGKSFNQQILNYTKAGHEIIVACYVDPIFNKNGEIVKYISIQTDITQKIKDHEYLKAFKTTLDQTEDCVFLFDGETLKFYYVNKGALDMMGYSEEELFELHPYDIKPEFPEKRFKEFIRPLKETGLTAKRFKTTHKTKNGEEIPVEVFLQYIKDDVQKPHFIAIVQDITDRILEKNNLERLSLVAENTTNLVVITDEKGYVEYVNKAFEDKSGYSLKEMMGKKPGQMLHGPKTNPIHIKANRAGIKTKKAFTQEILNYSKSGRTYWVSITFNPVFDENHSVTNFIAIETDITEKKLQEEQIRESEERLQFVLKGSELGYWDWNSQTGQMNVNNRWYEMLGYKPSDFEASIEKWHSLVHPEDMLKLNQIMDSVFPDPNNREFSVEVRAQHKSGDYIWILDRGAVVRRNRDGTPARISGMHMEISRRKNLERELEKERKFLRNIIGANALSVVVINKSGKITFANEGAEYIFGLKKETLQSRTYDDPKWKPITLDGEPIPFDELIFGQVLKFKRPIKDVEHGLVWEDGTIKYVSVTAAPLDYVKGDIENIIFSVTDITERILAEKELQITQSRMENIFRDISDVIWSIDLSGQQMNFITPSVEALTGYPQGYYLNDFNENKWKGNILPQDIHIYEAAHQKLIEEGSYEAEYRIATRSGEIKWILNKGNIIYKEGKPVRLDGILTDIAKRKQSEQDLNRYLRIVEDQNERLKNFAYIVSHNLRSHSANIQGLMYLINKRHPEIATNEYIQMLNRASNKLDDTLHHLNNVVSVVSSTEELKKVNLFETVNAFSETFQNLITESKIIFENKVSKDIFIEAVPAFLESVMTNLITNAIKYRDQQKSSTFVNISSRRFNGIVIISVTDNGLGIDLKKYGDKLFGMYKTFHAQKDSRGLGLFLTKNQVESMGGKIEVESTVRKGSIFKVFLKDGNI